MFQQKEFDYSQTPEVQQLYQEFVDAFEEKLIVEDFIPVVEAACGEQCSLLLKNYKEEKIRNQIRMNSHNNSTLNCLNQRTLIASMKSQNKAKEKQLSKDQKQQTRNTNLD
ncbi:unnamed protein product [Paramecium pentaurelia]|uniref:Uncharacterized protein n=1 Tax=Paramecium pentaurelia TaxID=43138 RepID=A0A8S1WZ60_9CILI|nr:unnamed protein product [Paramecium pentaurelia]